MLSVSFIYYYAECHYAECRYAECHGAICPGVSDDEEKKFLQPLFQEGSATLP